MDGRRVAWDIEAYVARVRATCFVCELVAGTPGYEHHVVGGTARVPVTDRLKR
jgi:hypothetical protein